MDIMTETLKFGEIIDGILNAMPVYGELLAKHYDDEADFIRKSSASDVIDMPGDRVIVGRITTNSIDRDGDVVLPQGGEWEKYNRVVLWSHDYGGGLFGGTQYELPHARNMWLRQFPSRNTKEIRAGTQYATKEMNAFGDQVYEYRLAKWPLGYSIGFIPIQTIHSDDKEEWSKTLTAWKKRIAEDTEIDIEAIKEPERFFTRWSLLEYSDVKIPANPDAVQLMISKGLMPEQERDKYTLKSEPSKPIDSKLDKELSELRKRISALEAISPREEGPEIDIAIDQEAIAKAFEQISFRRLPEGAEQKEIDIPSIFKQGKESVFKQ